MSPEHALEAIGRGMMQALLGNQPVAKRARGSSSSPKRAASHSGTAAEATTSAAPSIIPRPIQESMFEPPNAPAPTTEDLDKLLGITRITSEDPPGTYRPDQVEVKPWMSN